jgi:hypothetical protein
MQKLGNVSFGGIYQFQLGSNVKAQDFRENFNSNRSSSVGINSSEIAYCSNNGQSVIVHTGDSQWSLNDLNPIKSSFKAVGQDREARLVVQAFEKAAAQIDLRA